MNLNEKYIIGFVAVIIALVLFVSVKSEQKWQEFSRTHECQIVEKKSSYTALSTNGTAVVIPARNTYLCNDGVKYTREN